MERTQPLVIVLTGYAFYLAVCTVRACAQCRATCRNFTAPWDSPCYWSRGRIANCELWYCSVR